MVYGTIGGHYHSGRSPKSLPLPQLHASVASIRERRERERRDDKQSNILYYSIKPHYSYPFHTCIYIFVSTSYVFILLHKPFISNHWSKKEAENNKSTQREREKREKTDTILVFCWVETTHSALAITIIVHS